jgi:ketosteroid isomerase-like protein
MASANVDLVRSIYAAWEQGDFGSVEWANPQIEYEHADGPSPARWTGLLGLAKGYREWLAGWEEIRVFADDYREVDEERVLVLVHSKGHGRTSGLELEQIQTRGGANLFHVRDGKVTRLVLYYDRDRALADLGLTDWAMSENVEIVRRLYQGFNEGTAGERVPDLWHEDVELRPALIGGGILEGTVYRGHAGVLEFLAIQAETWERVTVEPVEMRELDAYVLVETRLQAVGRASGVKVTQVTWNRLEFRDGKVASMRVFTERTQALRATGLAG